MTELLIPDFFSNLKAISGRCGLKVFMCPLNHILSDLKILDNK